MSLFKRLLRDAVAAVLEERDDVVTRSEVGEIVEEYTADLEHDLTVEITQHVEDRIADAEGGGSTAEDTDPYAAETSYGGDSY